MKRDGAAGKKNQNTASMNDFHYRVGIAVRWISSECMASGKAKDKPLELAKDGFSGIRQTIILRIT